MPYTSIVVSEMTFPDSAVGPEIRSLEGVKPSAD